jgi:hypothetical protein
MYIDDIDLPLFTSNHQAKPGWYVYVIGRNISVTQFYFPADNIQSWCFCSSCWSLEILSRKAYYLRFEFLAALLVVCNPTSIPSTSLRKIRRPLLQDVTYAEQHL